jgi:hypothetical protein
VKYRHLLADALSLGGDEISLLAVLMLRGPQTPGELKQRTERLHSFDSLPTLEETLSRLIGRDFVERQPRQPGQKEVRYRQLLGGAEDETAAPVEHDADGDLLRRVAALEERVARIESELRTQ